MKSRVYRPFDYNQLHIDKTSGLEKGIAAFPSIYIEGAAACGKTTAIRMLLFRHPEVHPVIISMEQEHENVKEILSETQKRMEKERIWVVFEDINEHMSKEDTALIKKMLRFMPEDAKVIFSGRERPSEDLLELFWKREMELIPQESLLFTREEIRELLEKNSSPLKADEVYEVTGGWPGCVDLIIRFSERGMDAKELRETYEIDTYIEKELIGSLNQEEQSLVELGRCCPWVNEDLCRELWQMEDAGETLKGLNRKGIFYYNKVKEYHELNGLFRKGSFSENHPNLTEIAAWYEKKGKFREAFFSFRRSGDKKSYEDFVIRQYDKIPFLDVEYDEVMTWKKDCLKLCYLRGFYGYSHQYFEQLKTEIARVKAWKPSDKEEEYQKEEIYLNLMYLNPEIPLFRWMKLLEERNAHKIRLYSVLGQGTSFLCGLRDLSGLFACEKKEEARIEKIWKEAFGAKEWSAYCLAKVEYYMETKREDRIPEETWRVFYAAIGKNKEITKEEFREHTLWRLRLAGLRLLCKWPGLGGTEQGPEYIYRLESLLLKENNADCLRNTEAVLGLYSPLWKEPERLSKWLRREEHERKTEITEENYGEWFCLAKGWLILDHYEKAEKILERLIPYLQNYHRYRYFAEVLFGMAIVNWSKDKKGQAIRNMMESFLVTGQNRYADFYSNYGKKGREVLTAYVDWLKQTTPEGWFRKKKYNYGSVLRMPMEDYMEYLLRTAKKAAKSSAESSKGKNTERLTMMETIMLQSISRGLTNTEICEEQNLKMATVKSHIYSLYKKLGVSSRVQAVNKGKEMGIVR